MCTTCKVFVICWDAPGVVVSPGPMNAFTAATLHTKNTLAIMTGGQDKVRASIQGTGKTKFSPPDHLRPSADTYIRRQWVLEDWSTHAYYLPLWNMLNTEHDSSNISFGSICCIFLQVTWRTGCTEHYTIKPFLLDLAIVLIT